MDEHRTQRNTQERRDRQAQTNEIETRTRHRDTRRHTRGTRSDAAQTKQVHGTGDARSAAKRRFY